MTYVTLSGAPVSASKECAHHRRITRDVMTLNGPESQSSGLAQCFGIQYMEVDTAYRDNLLVF